jgi:CPA1 family monovalent cation:H+ antiporter
LSELLEVELLVLQLFLVVSVVGILIRRFRVPYTIALVIMGLILSLRSRVAISLTPEVILFLLLPPLVFEAAFHLNLRHLRKNLGTISVLAIPGVVASMFIVAGIVSFGTGLDFQTALVFGALIAAVDPVSVLAIFRKLGAPKQLEVLLEGESLFNDGTAIVLYGITLQAIRMGEFSVVDGIVDFVIISGGGIVIGLGLGWVATRLMIVVDDYLIETTLTTVLAFGSYLAAEQLHTSGVLAVVAAGLVAGNIGEKEMSPTTRIVVQHSWEFIAFLANSAVFLLIGLEIGIEKLLANWQSGLWAIAAVLVARAVAVYVIARLGWERPSRWQHILFWGGLRGAVALALALSLPTNIGLDRELVTLMTFSVVLFTLVFQGLSMERLLRYLGLITQSEEQTEYELQHARLISLRESFNHVKRLHLDGLISPYTWDHLKPVMEERIQALTRMVQDLLRKEPELAASEIVAARQEGLRSQRNLLSNLRSEGVLSHENYDRLVAEIDLALHTNANEWAHRLVGGKNFENVCQILLVVIQSKDLEAVTSALSIINIPLTLIQSEGGFLRHRNHVLLIGIPEGRLHDAIEAIDLTSESRAEFSTADTRDVAPLKGSSKKIEVSGATLFVLDVEHCEVVN